MRHYSLWDQLILQMDAVVRPVKLSPIEARPNPAEKLMEATLSKKDRDHSAGLMRVNHVGEVCAQALYQGQAVVARSFTIKKKLQKAAQEEGDHLRWCQERLQELNAHTSYLNPLWYITSLLIGLSAGLLGDKLSLGFLAETEHQVERHLTKHLQSLPLQDKKSRIILEQMREEEIEHAATATEAGAIPLPLAIQWGMRGLAKLMTVVAYRI